jgi:alpha-beta hydrolase superfamily lysophospholipase
MLKLSLKMKIIPKKIQSAKGNLSAVIHYPDKSTKKLAVLCPGYLDSKDYSHLVELAKALCKQGYVVVRFDPTGTWESEGNISDYTISQYFDDIRHIIDYMLSQNKYTQILIGGHSRGGEVSVLYASRNNKITGVLGIMPSHGPVTGQKRKKWELTGTNISFRDLPTDKNKKIEFRVPFNYVLDRDKYNALSDIKKIKVPVVLLAGELDDLVLPTEVKELFENANNPKKYLILKRIGHGYRRNDKEILVVNNEILKLLSSVKL